MTATTRAVSGAAAGVFALLFSACLVMVPPAARATPITYDFCCGAFAQLGGFGGNHEDISGSFTFDAATDTETDVTIDLTGLAAFSGVYVQTNAAIQLSNEQISAAGLTIDFNAPLDTSLDDIDGAEINTGAGSFCPCSYATSDVGGAAEAEATAAPEPASLALFGSALAGLGVIRRRRSKAALQA